MRVQRRVLEALAKAARAERASFPAGLRSAPKCRYQASRSTTLRMGTLTRRRASRTKDVLRNQFLARLQAGSTRN
jgi:hypothetical protein